MADYTITLTLSEAAMREVLQQNYIVIAADFKQDAALQEVFTKLDAKVAEVAKGKPEFATITPTLPPAPLANGMVLVDNSVVSTIVWLKDLKLWLISLVSGSHIFGRPDEVFTLKNGNKAKLGAAPA